MALTAALNKESERGEAASLLRSLIDQIVLTPKGNGEYSIDLHGDLAGILRIAAGKQKKIDQYDPILQQTKMMTGYDMSESNIQQEADETMCFSSLEIPENHQNLTEAALIASCKDKVVAGAGYHLIRLFQKRDHSTLLRAI